MTASTRTGFLQSFAASFADTFAASCTGSRTGSSPAAAIGAGGAGPRPEAWLQELVRSYITVHDLPLDPCSLALCNPPWVDGAPPPPEVAARWAPALLDAGVDILGQAREALLEGRLRHARGAFYTPSDVATALTALVLECVPEGVAAAGPRVPAVLDPAVGGGAFLVAAAGRLEAGGWSRRAIVEQGLWGIDTDPLAIAVTDAVLRCWVAGGVGAEADRRPVRTNLAVDDTLRNGPLVFPRAPAEGFDAVIGNPPFQNQLGAATARARGEAVELRPWLGTAAFRYADTATVFLAAALRLVRPGGRVGLILPQSFLVADDAAGVRDEILATGVLEHVWVATEPVFAAQVRVCAPVVQRHSGSTVAGDPAAGTAAARRGAPQRWRGRDFEAMGPSPVAVAALGRGSTWAPLVADLFGLPPVTLRRHGSDGEAACLSDICTATAGFRDQYYGLVPHVREATEAQQELLLAAPSTGSRPDDLAPLVTCGLIGPVWSDWGRRTTKFAKQTWHAPVVDLDALEREDPALHRWATARRVPKLVVATQTRVIEAVVDEDGRCYPSVPAIALACAPAQLWRAAAVVMSPVITLWAFHRHVGAALSADALKVSARQLLAAPLPTDGPAWDRAAAHLGAAHDCARRVDAAGWRGALEEFAVASATAYRLSAAEVDTVVSWWLARLPTPTPPKTPTPPNTRARGGRGHAGSDGLVPAGTDPDDVRRP